MNNKTSNEVLKKKKEERITIKWLKKPPKSKTLGERPDLLDIKISRILSKKNHK